MLLVLEIIKVKEKTTNSNCLFIKTLTVMLLVKIGCDECRPIGGEWSQRYKLGRVNSK